MTVSVQVRRTDSFDRVFRELKALDNNLLKEMRAEFRTEIRPYANELKSNIPGSSPLSGMSRGVRLARTRKSADDRSPYVWKKPSPSIDIGGRVSRRTGARNVVRIRFRDKRPYAAFSILETARQGRNQRGQNMVRGLNSKVAPVGKGRWVIEQFYKQRPELVKIARLILQKFGNKVSRRLGGRFV